MLDVLIRDANAREHLRDSSLPAVVLVLVVSNEKEGKARKMSYLKDILPVLLSNVHYCLRSCAVLACGGLLPGGRSRRYEQKKCSAEGVLTLSGVSGRRWKERNL